MSKNLIKNLTLVLIMAFFSQVTVASNVKNEVRLALWYEGVKPEVEVKVDKSNNKKPVQKKVLIEEILKPLERQM